MLDSLIAAAREAVPSAFPEGDDSREIDDIRPFGPEIDIDYPYIEVPPRRISREPGTTIVVSGGVDGPGESGPERWGGIEALAWYRSYHVDPDGWGIYVRAWGVAHLARHLGADPGSVSAAFDALWAHERAHFIADVASTVLEVNTGSPAYRPHLARARARKDPDHGGWCHVSEAVATAAQLDAMIGTEYLAPLSKWVRTLPQGYRDGGRYRRWRGPMARSSGRGALLGHLAGGNGDLSLLTAGSASLLWDAADHLLEDAEVPLYFVEDDSAIAVSLESLLTVADVRETTRFRTRVSKLHKESEWDKARGLLTSDLGNHGLRFKKLRGFANRFSVRVGSGYRAIMRLDSGGVLVAEEFDNRGDIYR